MTDPFTWDADTVAAYLSDSSRGVTGDPQTLSLMIREGQIDGEVLLTYGIELDDKQLQDHLGITKPLQQLRLKTAIRGLRKQSNSFQAWHAAFKGEPAPEVSQQAKSAFEIANEITTNGTHSVTTKTETPQIEETGDGSQPQAALIGQRKDAVHHELPANGETQPSAQWLNGVQQPPEPQGNMLQSAAADGPTEGDPLPATKRRRLAPVNLSSEPIRTVPVAVQPELEYLKISLGFGAETSGPAILESSSPCWYIGKGSVRRDDIRSTSTVLSTRLADRPDGGFILQLPNRQPPGRQLAVYRETKRLFWQNNEAIRLIEAGYAPPSRSGSLELNDLPDPNDWDEETLREVEAETRQREAEEQRLKKLSQNDVMRLMDEAMAKIKDDWHASKLPKYQGRAFKVWTQASRRGTRQLDIKRANDTIANLDRRLEKYRKEILREAWNKAGDVTRQACIFDQTIEDKLYQEWTRSVLLMREPPPKAVQYHGKRVAPRPRAEAPAGEEILMSSEDEDDFIVDDDGDEVMQEVHNQLQTEAENASWLSKRADRESSIMDLTLNQTPQKGNLKTVIDLTSPGVSAPAKKLFAPDQNGLDDIEEDAIIITSPEMVQSAAGSNPKDVAKTGDRTRFLISLLWKLNHSRRMKVFAWATESTPAGTWQATVEAYRTRISESQLDRDPEANEGNLQPDELQTAFEVTQLFLCYSQGHLYKPERVIRGIERRLSAGWEDDSLKGAFKAFLKILQQVAPHFPDDSQIFRREALLDDDIPSDNDFADEADIDGTPARRRRGAAVEVVQNKDALDLRQREAKRNAELEEKRKRLRAQLATSNSVQADRTQHIINEGKEDHQGFIYVSHEIGKRIKPHQIEGVRFLWNQIAQDAKSRQGCLLAHTMGLGKTMQVITFLVALNEASKSDDPTVREQVPADLRSNPTLIICPAGLVDNWMDELLTWSPADTLEPFLKVDSTLREDERVSAVEKWSKTGGTLVIGYEMLKQLFKMGEHVESLLVETPMTVVADEAHKLKNSQSAIHAVCKRFETNTRIALTGSPLANNVEEYYYMIDWVAPNFLGPPEEFKEIYSKDIEAGLYHDSLGSEKRKAIKMLQVLKETVAPKVHRATIAAMKNDLPNKYEFVISVAPTPEQRSLYDACIEVIRNTCNNDLKQSHLFAVLGILSLVCNHPKCLYTKVKETKEKETDKDNGGLFSAATIKTVLKMSRRMDIDNFRLSSKVILLTKILDDARAANEKVLVFSTSIPTLQYLEHVLVQQKRQIAMLDGSTTVAKRQNMVKNFNSGNKQVYLISTRAGGVGLNIQGANRVVLFDFKWNPMDEQQAIGRAYRIGQKKAVYVYRFVLAGTFEEDLHNKAVFKTQLASRVVDKKNPISWSKRGGQLLHNVKPATSQDLTPFLGKDTILDRIIKDHKDLIMSIMSTDTFEEEDHTAVLTADELKETEKLVHMNRLRMTDPAAYQREVERQRATEVMGLRSYPSVSYESDIATAGPSTGSPTSTLPQTMDGASDYPMIRSKTTNGVFGMLTTRGHTKLRYHEAPETNHGLPAPPPIAGSNTYFGQIPRVAPQYTLATQTPPQNPFQANLSRTRDDFERGLKDQVAPMQSSWGHIGPVNENTMASIVAEVDGLRRSKQLGVLPDDAQWKSLKSHLVSPRFTAATTFGRLTPQWLAFAESKDIQARVRVLDDMSNAEFDRFLKGLGNLADPMNLDNIRRSRGSSPGTRRSEHAEEDMKAMRAAADNRRRVPSTQLPSWAPKVLSTMHR